MKQTTSWWIFRQINTIKYLILLITSAKINILNIKDLLKLFNKFNFAPVAQLDRALGYGPGGSGFKS